MQRDFGEIVLTPVVLRVVARDPETYRVSARAGKTLRDKPDFLPAPDPFPSEVPWFTPYVPAGTAFDLANRSLQENCERPAPLPDVERWAAMAPYDEWVIWNVVWRRSPGQPSMAAARQTYGNLLDYNIRPLTRIYRDMTGAIEDYVSVARSMCALDADRCGDLGLSLVIAGKEAEAVHAYERWIAGARDQVGVANGLTWIVRYYYDTGRRPRAEELARLVREPAGTAAGRPCRDGGRRIHTGNQYQVLARLSFDPHMELIVWRDRRYQRIDANVPQRWIGATLDNYTAPNAR